ncbi:hypothetical protein [Burkholderia gladioli]|uniref:hypothetical protein n=1 Tax=Burkholderia gladioli TaxID=28095 RepID=UPI00163F9110|nr:hypothetical protein [Burkholderia gladioli]
MNDIKKAPQAEQKAQQVKQFRPAPRLLIICRLLARPTVSTMECAIPLSPITSDEVGMACSWQERKDLVDPVKVADAP